MSAQSPAPNTPHWAASAGRWHAFLRGLAVAAGVPGAILFATSIGFGALAREMAVGIDHAVALAAVLYALPAQVVFVDQIGRGAGIAAAALAITLTAIRLLPMTVVLAPYFRDDPGPRGLRLLAVHFVAITAWLEGLNRIPALPGHLRVPHFIGIGTGLMVTTMIGTAAGYVLSASVPAPIAAALLFATPAYFLLSLIGASRSRADVLAIILGAALGPALYAVLPGFDLLATGLIGGTAAWALGRRRS